MDDDNFRKAQYSKLQRALEDKGGMIRSTLPPAVMARYSMDKDDEKAKFLFLAEFVHDPTWAQLTLTEQHYKDASNTDEDKKSWKTVGQEADHYKISIEDAANVVKNKPSMPNPDAPDNERLTLFKVFFEKTDTDRV